jgi:hypothetical protein
MAVIFEFVGTSELAILAIYGLILVVPLWRICVKAGFPGWYSLIVYVPLLNLIALWILAFARWPNQKI